MLQQLQSISADEDAVLEQGHTQSHVATLFFASLQANEAVKKSDVMSAANAAGMVCTDKDYVKIMKELCTSKGSNWSLRRDSHDEGLEQAKLL